MKPSIFLRLSFPSFCLWFLFVSSLCISICFCNENSDPVLCIPTERLALIDLKNNLTDETNRLSSWIGKDCCSWSGVVCDNITGHVHEIRLAILDVRVCLKDFEDEDERVEASKQKLGGTISPSVVNLLQLRHLDLSCNEFGYSSIPTFMGSFQNLIYLNLSYFNFSGKIPHQLGNLSTLRVLDLHGDALYDLHSKSLAWLKNLKGLRHLDMRHIDLFEASDWFSAVSNLTSLQELHFSECSLPRFPSNPTRVSFTSLAVLDLSNNYMLDNSMLPGWIFSLRNLAVLDLSNCFIKRVNPGAHGGFYSMPSLTTLLLSSNKFVNSLSILNGLSSLSNLRLLDVRGCGISLPILGSLQNLSLIEHIDLSFNQIVEEIPKSLSNLCNIITLDLTSNTFSGYVSELLDRFCECESPKLELLYFGDNSLIGQLPERLGRLKKLVRIDLGSNNLTGTIPDSIGSLSLLQMLYISKNQLSGLIPNTIGGLSSLETLNLEENNLSGSLPESIGGLSSLKELNLRDNKLSESLPESIGGLSSLEGFDLSYNKLNGSVPESIGGLSSLERFDLSYNNLNGSVPESIGGLSSLERFNLSYNNLNGSVPESIGGLSSLERFDLSYNKLRGSLPESIGGLSKLEFLSLDHNSFTGNVTKNHFANLTALEYLFIGDNKLEFKLNVNNWIPPFMLKSFRANSCSLGPQFPSWIRSQANLKELDVSNTNISDTIPNWFWTTFPDIYYLNMSHNSIQGKLGDITTLGASFVDLSNNHLHGMLHNNLSKASFDFLDLSGNNLSGSLEQFLCSGIQQSPPLQFLNLANNNMSGVIPDCWINFQHLVILNLEKNHFSGVIPPSLGNLSSLSSLDIDDNMLSGTLPPWLLNSNSLVVIELARNELTGKIPSSIGRNNTILRVVSLPSNKFEGKIADEICHLSSLQILDLAHNDLSGNLPTCFTNFSIISGRETTYPIFLYQYTISPESQAIKASLVIKGNTYTYSTILYLVISLDLSSNKFSGTIPGELVGLLGLRFLNLSHNDLSGPIPNSFSQIGKLESLDLSMNHLRGNIPLSLSQLTSLNCLNMSYNNLEGSIPRGPQLQTFNESSFTGNALCGAPLPACSQNNNEGTTDRHDESNGTDWILVILIIVGLLVGFWMVLIPLFLSRRWRNIYYHFLEGIWFRLQNYIFLLFLRLTKRCTSRYD